MSKIFLRFDWLIPLLISPLILGLAIFCYLLWSDSRYNKKRQQKVKSEMKKK